MISGKNISWQVNNKKILESVDIDILPGKLTAVIGPNGSGKSSLLKIMAGSGLYDSGVIKYGQKSLTSISPKEISMYRSVVSQSYPDDIPFTGREIINMPIPPGSEINKSDLAFLIDKLRLAEFIDRRYHLLSGGEKQRIQIARAITQYFVYRTKGYILFLDEPSAGLDITASAQLAEILDDLIGSDLGICWVLHDINMALELADRIVILKSGNAVTYENPSELLNGRILQEAYGIPFVSYTMKDTDDDNSIPKLHPKYK